MSVPRAGVWYDTKFLMMKPKHRLVKSVCFTEGKQSIYFSFSSPLPGSIAQVNSISRCQSVLSLHLPEDANNHSCKTASTKFPPFQSELKVKISCVIKAGPSKSLSTIAASAYSLCTIDEVSLNPSSGRQLRNSLVSALLN